MEESKGYGSFLTIIDKKETLQEEINVMYSKLKDFIIDNCESEIEKYFSKEIEIAIAKTKSQEEIKAGVSAVIEIKRESPGPECDGQNVLAWIFDNSNQRVSGVDVFAEDISCRSPVHDAATELSDKIPYTLTKNFHRLLPSQACGANLHLLAF